MKIAIVHDYIKEYGGAERVLKVLTEMYPKAPIYTAFSVKGSTAEKEFRGRLIHESWLAPLLKIGKLYSPLRFLTPLVWGSFNLSKYDLVITSCSWYITRGFKMGPRTKVVAYCHTPPRWLYGYETSVGFTKYWPVKIYSAIVGHFMRIYDFKTTQKPLRNKEQRTGNKKIISGVDYWIANSKNVQARIKKFYRKDSTVIYPPVDVEGIMNYVSSIKYKSEDYFLIVSRLVGAKGLEETVNVFSKLGGKYKLKIVGEAHGYSNIKSQISNLKSPNIELLGRVNDEDLYKLYARAKGFIALARDEDFGITPVESMASGTPVIAFNGSGFKESVIDGVTGILINDTDEKTITQALKRFDVLIHRYKDKDKLATDCRKQAKKFSKERFIKEMREFVSRITN
jgi:glycosyltransferase involved in cell wall biosynthesis